VATLLADGPLPVADALAIGSQVCDGLIMNVVLVVNSSMSAAVSNPVYWSMTGRRRAP
jgi:hypothetical protein